MLTWKKQSSGRANMILEKWRPRKVYNEDERMKVEQVPNGNSIDLFLYCHSFTGALPSPTLALPRNTDLSSEQLLLSLSSPVGLWPMGIVKILLLSFHLQGIPKVVPNSDL